jgi:hypothetical protein
MEALAPVGISLALTILCMTIVHFGRKPQRDAARAKQERKEALDRYDAHLKAKREAKAKRREQERREWSAKWWEYSEPGRERERKAREAKRASKAITQQFAPIGGGWANTPHLLHEIHDACTCTYTEEKAICEEQPTYHLTSRNGCQIHPENP